jgi:haloalkane dehalogenase
MQLSAEEVAAYDAPFPDDSYKAGARIFPSFVPVDESYPEVAENRAAWEVLRQYNKPWLCAFSDKDPITKGGDGVFLREVPGTQGQSHVTITGAGHFLQENKGEELAQVIVDFIASTL